MSERRRNVFGNIGIGGLLLVVAALCFFLAVVGVKIGDLDLVPAGLFFLTLGLLL